MTRTYVNLTVEYAGYDQQFDAAIAKFLKKRIVGSGTLLIGGMRRDINFSYRSLKELNNAHVKLRCWLKSQKRRAKVTLDVYESYS